MSVGSTRPATEIRDAQGRRATVDADGSRIGVNVADQSATSLLREIVEELREIKEIIAELAQS